MGRVALCLCRVSMMMVLIGALGVVGGSRVDLVVLRRRLELPHLKAIRLCVDLCSLLNLPA